MSVPSIILGGNATEFVALQCGVSCVGSYIARAKPVMPKSIIQANLTFVLVALIRVTSMALELKGLRGEFNKQQAEGKAAAETASAKEIEMKGAGTFSHDNPMHNPPSLSSLSSFSSVADEKEKKKRTQTIAAMQNVVITGLDVAFDLNLTIGGEIYKVTADDRSSGMLSSNRGAVAALTLLTQDVPIELIIMSI